MKQQDTIELPATEKSARPAGSRPSTKAAAPASSSGKAVGDGSQQPIHVSKLMQSYRLESPVSATGTVQAVLDGSGNLAVFTTGTNNRIYVNRFTPGSETGWVQSDTGLQSTQPDQFAAALDLNGRLVVAVPANATAAFVEEKPDGTWGSPQSFVVAGQGLVVYSVRLKRLHNVLWISAIFGHPGQPSYACAGPWNGAQTQMTMGPQMPTQDADIGWNSALGGAGLFLLAAPAKLFFCPATSEQPVQIPVRGELQIQRLALAEDASGVTRVCAIVTDPDTLYTQPYVYDPAASEWICLDPGGIQTVVESACAMVDAAGLIDVFAVGKNQLYHVREAPGAAANSQNAAGWDVPTVLMPGALVGKPITPAIGVCRDGDGDPNVLVVTTDSALFQVSQEVSQSTQDGNTTLWDAAEIELASTGNLDELQAYSTEITVLDADGVALQNAQIQLRSDDPVLAFVAGRAVLLDPVRAYTCSANVAGSLTVAVPTASLHTPQLLVWAQGMDADDVLTIEPNETIQDRLRGVTVDQLLEAADMEGNPIIKEPYRSTAWLDPLQQAVVNGMSLVQARRAVRSAPASDRHAGGLIDLARVPEQHWQFDTSSGVPVFRHLSAQEAQDEFARLQANYVSTSLLSWLNDVGDVVNEALNGAVEGLSVLASTAADAINLAFTFVLDGVKYVYNVTTKAIQVVFAAVEAAFTVVKVAFEELFQWLGQLLNWTKIRLTHEAIKYVIQEVGLPFLQGALGQLQSTVDDGFNTARGKAADGFDTAIALLGGQNSSFVDEAQVAPEVHGLQPALSNNLVLDTVADNLDRIAIVRPPNRRGDADDPLANLAAAFGTQVTPFQDSVTCDQLMDTLAIQIANADSADSVVQARIASLLQILQEPTDAVLAQMQGGISGIIGLIQQAIGVINEDVLNMELEIPLLTDLYAKYVDPDDSLTALSVMSLAIALPADAMYFTVFDRHPFETDDELQAFKDAFTVEWLMEQSKLLPTGTQVPADIIPIEARQIISQVLGCVLAASYAVLSYTQRIQDVNSATGGKVPTVALIGLVAGWIRWASAVPWGINPNNNAKADFSDDAQEFGNATWLVNMMTPAMATAFYTSGGSNEETAIGFTVTGLIQEVFACVYASLDAPNRPKAHSEAIVSMFPVLFKFLRHQRVMSISKGVSLVALVALDALCFLVAFEFRVAQLASPDGARAVAAHAV